MPIPSIKDIDSVYVDPKPTLLIFDNYKSHGTERVSRISDIEKVLKKAKIIYNIVSEI